MAVSFATILLVRYYRSLGRGSAGTDPSREVAQLDPAATTEAVEIPLENPEGAFQDKFERLASEWARIEVQGEWLAGSTDRPDPPAHLYQRRLFVFHRSARGGAAAEAGGFQITD